MIDSPAEQATRTSPPAADRWIRSGLEQITDGDRYAITGQAVGVDTSNPTNGMLSKTFELVVTCR
ncbi:lipoprotein LpqH [Nocardioides carbamazepini]|uniref:lipoprotein LpqH n=1 Tax=Nocardioides carbamazepini TaxID=2854259 RepID=UPI0035581FFD|nr:lipoprotein LpqH [Nocardioides carbamazepini]